jgi:hypothetical protein
MALAPRFGAVNATADGEAALFATAFRPATRA